jgi:hypothetical protein
VLTMRVVRFQGHKHNLASKIGKGGGGKTDHGYWEPYCTKESNLKERKICPIKG